MVDGVAVIVCTRKVLDGNVVRVAIVGGVETEVFADVLCADALEAVAGDGGVVCGPVEGIAWGTGVTRIGLRTTGGEHDRVVVDVEEVVVGDLVVASGD